MVKPKYCPRCNKKMSWLEFDKSDEAMGSGFHIDGCYWCFDCGYYE